MSNYSPAGYWFGLAGPFATYDEAVAFARLSLPLPGSRLVIDETDETGTTIAVWGSETPGHVHYWPYDPPIQRGMIALCGIGAGSGPRPTPHDTPCPACAAASN